MAVDAATLFKNSLATARIALGGGCRFRKRERTQEGFESKALTLVESKVRHAALVVVFRRFAQKGGEGEIAVFIADLPEPYPAVIACCVKGVAADAALVVEQLTTQFDRFGVRRECGSGGSAPGGDRNDAMSAAI